MALPEKVVYYSGEYQRNLKYQSILKESFKKYKKQKNYSSRLYKRERKSFFESIDSSKITDNKTFWKNIQPFFSEKRKTVNKITLVNENEDILSNNKVVADEIAFLKMQQKI